MKLVSITLDNIRRFSAPVTISGIGTGLNVLCAPNENGKSTLFDALHALFFVPHRSGGKEIKSLKPHAGGAPEVTAEIDLPEGRFRIVKRWTTKAVAEVWQGDRLVAKADEAEAWISGLSSSGGDGGPAGLLWVRQGLTQLDHDRAKDHQGSLTTRRDLMSSVTGEVEALTGGRRMDMALARARADLAPLLNPNGKPKAGGPLAKAEAEVAILIRQQADLEQIARRLADALSRRMKIRQTLAELQDPIAIADRKRRLADASAAFDAARRHAEALEQADRMVRIARQDLHEATRKCASLAQAQEIAARARKAADDAQTLARTAQGSLATAETASHCRLATVDDARTHRAGAESVLRAALRAETARGSQARRQELAARLATLQDLSEKLAAQNKAAATGPDAKAIARLDAQVQEVSVLRSLRTSAATRVTMAYCSSQRVSLAGAELADGQPTPILAECVLRLPGLGDLTIRPADGSDQATRLQEAEADLGAQLARLGYPTPEAARAAAYLRAEASASVKDIETRLAALAPHGVAAVQTELDQLPEATTEDPDLPPVTEAQALCEAASLALQSAEQGFETARALAEQERLAEARSSVSVQGAAAALIAAEATLAAFGDLAQAEATLSAACNAAEGTLGTATDHHADLARHAPDLGQAEAALARAASVASGAERDIATLSEERAGLDREIDLRSGEGVAEDLADVSTRLAAAQGQRDRLLFEVAVLKDLIAALESARDMARERYFAPVMAELKPLLRLLWPDAELKFDGDSLLPTALIRNGQEEDIGILSGGTQEQIALFVRLAFARLLARTGRHAPVILDDALVYTDDDRIERVFDALHGQANDLQIIVLSCRQRAFRDLGGQKLTFDHA